MYTYSHLEDFIFKVYRNLNILSPADLNIHTIADALNISLYSIGTCSQAIHFEGRHYIFLDVRLTAPERFEMFGHDIKAISFCTQAINSICALITVCIRNGKRIYLQCISVSLPSCCKNSQSIF